MTPMAPVHVRPAAPDELVAVRNVLDGAALQVERSLPDVIAEQAVLVAVSERETVLGALVLSGREITAVAVRPGRRGQGIGTRLVDAARTHDSPLGDAARAHNSPLVAEFDSTVADFWRAVGFRCEPLHGDRLRGELLSENPSGQ